MVDAKDPAYPLVGAMGAVDEDPHSDGEEVDPLLRKPPGFWSRLNYVLHAKSTMWFVDGPPTHHRLSQRDESSSRRWLRTSLFLLAIMLLFAWMMVELQVDGYESGINEGASVRLTSYDDAQTAGSLDAGGDARVICFCAAGGGSMTVTDVSMLVETEGRVFPNQYLPIDHIRASKSCERRWGEEILWDPNITYVAKDPQKRVLKAGPVSPSFEAARRFAVVLSELPQTYQPFNALLLTQKQWVEATLSQISSHVEFAKVLIMSEYRSRPELLYQPNRIELTRIDCLLDKIQMAFYCALRAAMGTPPADNVIQTWEDEGTGFLPCAKLAIAANISVTASDPEDPEEYISDVADLYSAYTHHWCGTNATACLAVSSKTGYERFVGLFNVVGGIYSAMTLVCVVLWAIVIDAAWIVAG
ncbi:MAG: hypothetical protein J3K34DRAFT_416147 [Monoraphidium minutum]|nr:MAG: hypothetical protein J3K34DRAFT_416147 [Monoraphidium minutum]